jgi:hypothetical protein
MGGRGEMVMGGEGGRVHVGEDVGDVEVHCQGVEVGLKGEGDWWRRGWKGGEGLGRADHIWRVERYIVVWVSAG